MCTHILGIIVTGTHQARRTGSAYSGRLAASLSASLQAAVKALVAFPLLVRYAATHVSTACECLRRELLAAGLAVDLLAMKEPVKAGCIHAHSPPPGVAPRWIAGVQVFNHSSPMLYAGRCFQGAKEVSDMGEKESASGPTPSQANLRAKLLLGASWALALTGWSYLLLPRITLSAYFGASGAPDERASAQISLHVLPLVEVFTSCTRFVFLGSGMCRASSACVPLHCMDASVPPY